MKLQQLHAFIAAVEAGSIRGAARALFLTQPAVTKALRELEESLGVSLIQRSVRGIQVTESGARLLVRARLIARQVHLAGEELQQLQGDAEGTVSIGVTPLVALTLLPEAIAAFQATHRKVRLHIVEGLEGVVLPGVRMGALDFGIMIVTGEPLGEDLIFEPWFSTASTVVVRQGHPLERARTLAEFADQEWLATSFGANGRGGKVAGFFAEAGLPPPARTLRCDSVLTGMAIVRNTDVVTLMPTPILDCPETRGLRAVALAKPPPRNHFGLIMRADVPLAPVAAAFAALLKENAHCLKGAGRG